MKYYDEIREYVDSLYVIDTHEHLFGREEYCSSRGENWDVLCEYLEHYFSRDLISAGMPKQEFDKLFDTKIHIAERFMLAEPYWDMARYTGYGRALDISVKGIYGFERIDRNTIEPLNEEFRKSFGKGQYERVLKEKSKIIISILDNDLNCDRRYFRSVFQLGSFILPKSADDILRANQYIGRSITCLDDFLEACKSAISDALEKGAIAFKTPMAYERSLSVSRSTYHQAEEAFNEFYRVYSLPDWTSKPIYPPKEFQDYMIHFILRELSKRGVVVQIHTGIQEGNGNIISNSNPMLLSNLFLEYPDVKFDVFHMGYPYQQELSALAKIFPNVFIDMCWGHIISPTASVNALIEWLDAVPANKISAFGGDYCLVDGVYGHQVMARHDVSVSLAKKVKQGSFDVDEAKRIAWLLFVENPARLFGLRDLI